jgi:predicted PurR-regulated permease PerM
MMKAASPIHTQSEADRHSALFYVVLAAALLIFIHTFAVLSPILLSLLLILLISLAVNPVIGPFMSAVPALLLAFGEGGLTPLWVVLAYLVIQGLEGNVITPMIMAHGMKLHPLAVIFSMLLCVAAFGVLGVLVAAPLVAIVSILHDELYRKRFLPTVTDADLDRLSRMALHEKVSVRK